MRPLHLLLAAMLGLGPIVLTATPTPPAPRVRAWVEGERLLVSRRVMFRQGELQVTPESRPVLDAMAAALKALPPDRIIVVEGHSDSGGDETENILLSRARAEYVLTALIRRGLDPTKLRAEGMGSSRPLVEATHPEQYRNRRIEVYILPGSAPHLAPAATILPPVSIAVPLLGDEVVVALAAPRPMVPLLEDDDDVRLAFAPRVPLLGEINSDADLMPLSFSDRSIRPSIPLLDEVEALHIGLVD